MGLEGRTILTTRAASSGGELRQRLEALGARVIECPAIEIAPIDDWTDVDRAIRRLDSYDWLVLTSANAVTFFMRRAETLRAPCRIPIAVVGPSTARALEPWRLTPSLTPADFRAEGVLAAFPENLSGKRILFPRAETAREILPDELRRRGALVDVVVVYRTVRGAGMDDIAAILARESIDCVVFTSPSTVHFVAGALQETPSRLQETAIAVIGPVTRQAAEAAGLRPVIEPSEATASSLAEAIHEYFKSPSVD
ncbi:MAG TPA: uroporphyrinogen-III synthase [Terriglobia bacterium]|nr:uroporphyrinogen-III synthase [Terriglobia bacterium]